MNLNDLKADPTFLREVRSSRPWNSKRPIEFWNRGLLSDFDCAFDAALARPLDLCKVLGLSRNKVDRMRNTIGECKPASRELQWRFRRSLAVVIARVLEHSPQSKEI